MKPMALLFLVFSACLLPWAETHAAIFPPNDTAPVKDGKVMVRLGDLQLYPGRFSKKLKGTAYFATVVVERSDLKIEEGRMIYDCQSVPSSRQAVLQCEDVEYIRPVKP